MCGFIPLFIFDLKTFIIPNINIGNYNLMASRIILYILYIFWWLKPLPNNKSSINPDMSYRKTECATNLAVISFSLAEARALLCGALAAPRKYSLWAWKYRSTSGRTTCNSQVRNNVSAQSVLNPGIINEVLILKFREFPTLLVL